MQHTSYAHNFNILDIIIKGNGMGIKIGYFGDFYPKFKNALFSTGTVYLLSKHTEVESIYLYATKGCKIPPNFGENIHLFESWNENSIVSLLRTLLLMNSHKKKLDTFFFNLSLTSQSKKSYVNVLSLLLPVFLSFITKKKIAVYLHDIVETQNFETLGYNRSRVRIFVAKLLERFIAIRVTMILPMEYQVRALYNTRKKDLQQIFFPYAEAIWAYDLYPPVAVFTNNEENNLLRVLLWGSWGPKKDIIRVIKKLKELIEKGCNLKVKVVGNINPHFAYYQQEFYQLIQEMNNDRILFILDAPDEIAPNTFFNSDILLLPYLGSVGISGVMNIGAFYGIKMVSYSVPELVDFSQMVNGDTLFIPTGDLDELERILCSGITPNIITQSQYIEKRDFAMEMVGRLIYCLSH